MADLSLKNRQLTQSASDLGLGDILQSQVETKVLEEQKKKQSQSIVSDLMSPAATMLLGGTQ